MRFHSRFHDHIFNFRHTNQLIQLLTDRHPLPPKRQGTLVHKQSSRSGYHVNLYGNPEPQVHATGHPAQSIPERSFHPGALDSRDPRPRLEIHIHIHIHVEAAYNGTGLSMGTPRFQA